MLDQLQVQGSHDTEIPIVASGPKDEQLEQLHCKTLWSSSAELRLAYH